MFGNNAGFNSFGAQNNNAQGGLFGANKPNNGGLFGNNSQPQNTGGVFGNQNNGGVFGGGQQPNAFGQPNSQPPQALFGNNQAPANNGGLFGNNNQQNQGLFGNNQQPAQGLFAGQQAQQNTGGLFGNQQGTNANGGGLFGGQQQGGFGNVQPQGAFGNNQQQGNSNGLFGGGNQQGSNGLFGNNQQQPQAGGNLFGGNNQNGGGLFGAASNNANNSFLANQQPAANPFNVPNTAYNNTNNGLFGGNTNTNTSVFGNNAQQPGTTNAGGLFNTFAPTQPQQQNGFFGQATNTLGTTASSNSSIFGNNSAFNNNTTNNKLGGTAWGVPTTLTSTPSMGNPSVGVQTIQPVKSKNSKLDAKHLIKCIAALDQFNGLTKEEIRINFIQTGGQQPIINQQQTLQPISALTPAKPGFTAPTSLPSFGGISNNNINTSNTSLFGGQQPVGAFGQNNTAFGTNPGQSSMMFGQGTQPNSSLFGAKTQPQQGTSLFGQQPATTSLFGQTPNTGAPSMFGTQPAAQGTSLFGQPAATTSLFGQPQQPTQTTPSLFGQPATTPSLFGQPATTTPSLFGGPQPTQPLFGQTPATQPSSLFNAGQTPSLFGTNPQTTLFGPAAPTQQPGFFNQPTAFGQLTSPLFQAPQGLDPNLQVLLPQVLLSLALNQAQNPSTNYDASSNPTLQLISKLTSLLNISHPSNQNGSASAAASTPFDEFMREARNEKLIQQKKENEQSYSLFSDFEKESNYYLESASYPRKESRNHQELFEIKTIHKVPKKSESIISSQHNQREIARKYKYSQEEGRRKINNSQADLPKIGNFSIFPSLEKLKSFTSDQLRSVQLVRIWNQYGQIQFLQPISLFRLSLEESLTISQDNIEITESSLQEAKMRMTFKNFGRYTTLKGDEKQKMLKKMRKWIEKYEMREISHDSQSGDLIVEVDH